MDIVYSDNHLLLVNKRAGMTVQPELHELAREWVQKEFKKPGRAFLEPIHRLDKPVSGLVLFARTSKALSRLNSALREKKMKKTYLARVEGLVEEDEAELEHYLVHDDFRARIDPKGKQALLAYRVLERSHGTSLLEIELKTGRYHQIRVQLSAIGHPIVGDGKYGSAHPKEQIALHHHSLELIHPTLGIELTFSCPAHTALEWQLIPGL